MHRLAAVALLALAACQPLYGGKGETMKSPEKSQPKDGAPAGPTVVEVMDCDTNFHLDHKGVTRNPTAADALVADGDTEVAAAKRQPEPAARAAQIKEGLDRYSTALRRDPYHAEATLKLAVAYDRVHFRGCALAVLERLGDLQTNPTLAEPAERAADQVASRKDWFTTYRKDALKAVNR